jgi:uncharacterized phage-associated protein
MKYDIEKLADILYVFSKNGQHLTKLRICKFLYFIDKLHLQKYGRFVLGDRYHSLQFGQIPSLTLDILNDFFDPEITFRGKPIKSNPHLLKDYFIRGKYKNKYPSLILNKEFNFKSLSDSEIGIINEVLKKFGKYTDAFLVNLSHKEATWQKTPVPQQINPELFLDDLPEDEKKRIAELMIIDEADDTLVDSLNR